ncbi:hypothetical protein [Amycolatopsis sp.]|jgi:hypothetical protein|uniref:hypothetical protein n=1 Tax=Amycolatopsis sp. TaxID=37632 RepID=UPI002E044E9F|nr:hypothetical protein [Amycolatopsis sp.]
MNHLANAVVESVEWARLRGGPGTAAGVAEALTALADAESEKDATKHYWQIDNTVVVQGSLYESALPAVRAAFALLVGPLSIEARYRVVEVLVEIAGGETAQAEVEAGNADLAERCRAELREGLWLFYGLLLDPDARMRKQGLTVLGWLEENPQRIVPVLAKLTQQDPEESVRDAARELMGEFLAEG